MDMFVATATSLLKTLFIDIYNLDFGDIDNLIDVRTKTLLLQYIHDDNHFLNDFLEKCPSGRYRTSY